MASDRYVLVVDDDEAIRVLLKTVLERAGYRVRVATNGRDALTIVSAASGCAVVLLDLIMPVMNGRDFIARVKAEPRLASIPIVVLTGSVAPVPEATQVIIKPIKIADVLAAVAWHAAAT